jgi:DNA-binding NtrC family response regulator
MRFSAVDYLLKPINIKELVEAVNRAFKQNQLKSQQ